MFKKVLFIVLYFFTWTLFFQGARLLFLLYQFTDTIQLPAKTIALTFWNGLRMDLSMAGYITIPICLFVLISVVIPFFRSRIVYLGYSSIILFILILLLIVDLEAYKAWGFRIDTTPLKYLSSLKEVWASISHLPVFWIGLGLIVLNVFFYFISKYYTDKLVKLLLYSHYKIVQGLLILGITVLMIIPIRVGLQLAPMNESGVYFSQYHFANLAAVNAPWNFLHALSNQKITKNNPYRYMDAAAAKQVVNRLFSQDSIGNSYVKITGKVNPNIILIIWESFTEKATKLSINGKEVTPYFNQLKKEGIYFSNAYASGDRTDKGLSAVLSGYPALPKMSIIRFPSKAAKLPSVSKFFNQNGYYTSFYYGGETEFANIKSYLLTCGFDKLTAKKDFKKKDQNSKWGAHDGVVANRIIKEQAKINQPFFTTWLTLSSHEPFEIPTKPTFEGNSDEIKFLNSINYTDAFVFNFVKECKKQPWWDNTLLLIVADHGHRYPESKNKLEEFRIPILWLGGALSKSNIINDQVVSQLDIATSLTDQVGSSKRIFQFSRNMFDSTNYSWSFFSYNNAFGFVTAGNSFLFDNVGKTFISNKGSVNKDEIEKGKALQQYIYQDFLEK